jgi:hypothetical protein
MYVVQIKLNLLRLNLKFIPICLFSSCANSTLCVLLCVFLYGNLKHCNMFGQYIFSNKQQTSLNLEPHKTGPSILGTNTNIHLGAMPWWLPYVAWF